MEAEKAALMKDSENARKLEAIVQMSFTKTQRLRIPIVYLEVCNNKRLKSEDAQIWQKVTSYMQSEADADRLATVLAPFGLIVPPELRRGPSQLGSSFAIASDDSDEQATFTAAAHAQALTVDTKETEAASGAAVEPAGKPTPLVTDPVATHNTPNSLHPNHAVPRANHVDHALARNTKKPPAKTPTSKRAARSPAQRSTPMPVRLQPRN